MWGDILKALGQAVVQHVGQAATQLGYRQFVMSLFAGDEQTALARLRQHVHGLDAGQYTLFMQTLRVMHAEAVQLAQQAAASGGNDAWGSSVEDRIALSMAQIKTGDYSASRQAVAQAQQAVAGLERIAQLSEQFRAEMPEAPATQVAPDPQRQALLNALRPKMESLAQMKSEMAKVFEQLQERAMAPPKQDDEQRVSAMIDELAKTGKMPDGMSEALSRINDPAAMERLMQKMKDMGADQLGDRPLDDIANYYRDGEGLYKARWPIAIGLPLPFDQLDRPTQFHVLFAECRRRLTEASALRNTDKLDAAMEAFRECLERADQIDVPILKSDAYQGLMTVFEKGGDRAQADRYLQLAERERARQAER